MELQMVPVVLSTFICIQSQMQLPRQFWVAFHSLEGPDGIAVKSKIYQGLMKSDQGIWEDRFPYVDHTECLPTLLRIMKDDLKCPRAANEMKPYLDLLEFTRNMTRDETLSQGIFEKNCSYLDGNSAQVCQLVISRGSPYVAYELFEEIISNCQIENSRNVSLSRKLV